MDLVLIRAISIIPQSVNICSGRVHTGLDLKFHSDSALTRKKRKRPLVITAPPRPLAPRLQTSIRETPGYWITQYHGSPGRVLICRSQKISAVMLKLKDIRRYRFPLFECCSKNYRTLRKDIFTILKFNVHSKMTCTEAKSFQSEGKQ